MIATITSPKLIQIGGGAAAQSAEVLARVGVSRPLIVTDPFLAGHPLLERLTEPLEAAGIAYQIFSDTVPDPTTDVVDAGLEALRGGDFDGLIGFGGGSPMDTAKAMAILHAGGGKMRDYKVPAVPDLAVLPIVCVPTTAGTGSEVTKVCVITDTETDEKMLIMGLAALPTAAVVDYELTMEKPLRLTADTGIDSLTHAIEAYVSKKANPHTDVLARNAMRLIHEHLRTACREPGNEEAREAMSLAALQAGVAFSNASVALVHGMSRPIGAFFHVPHGLSNAMLLPAVTAFSLSGAPERYAECARVMGAAAAGDGDAVAHGKLLAVLRELNADLEVPGPGAYGIEEGRYFELLPTMADQAIASGSPANNPRVPSAEEIVGLYREVWRGGAA